MRVIFKEGKDCDECISFLNDTFKNYSDTALKNLLYFKFSLTPSLLRALAKV